MAITSYQQYMQPAGKAGQLANYQGYTADTHIAKEVIPFGAAVQLTADGTGVTLLKVDGVPMGVALAQNIHDYINKADDQNYPVSSPAAIVKRGRIFVNAGGNVVNGDSVKVDITTGKFVATSETAIDFPKAVFKANSTTGNLVEIEINLP